MELIKDDTFPILHSYSGSGQQRAAIHAPVPRGWDKSIFKGEGSGGLLVPALLVDTSGSSITLKVYKPDPLAYLINRIEVAFGLTRDELAKISNTTRKTIYNWLDGTSEPRNRNKQRLFKLDILASDWADSGFTTDRVSLRQPIVDGRSVFELLCDDPIDTDLVLFAGSRLAIDSPPKQLADPFAT